VECDVIRCPPDMGEAILARDRRLLDDIISEESLRTTLQPGHIAPTVPIRENSVKHAFIAALALAMPVAAAANSPEQALSKCLAENTTGKERKQFAQWVFLAMAAHGEIKQFLAPSAIDATDEANKTLARTFMRLVTESCAKEARDAYQNGGAVAFQSSFAVLGELAMQELMGDRAVAESMSAFEKYLDAAKLNQALVGK
jgi:hypothetical protein